MLIFAIKKMSVFGFSGLEMKSHALMLPATVEQISISLGLPAVVSSTLTAHTSTH